ncbi:hypothetical protein BMS3Bbin02_00402 [bacterium BMS3Bbin02]|nr:hypothetical protein BMS3Bbin02_00402 [bacterium BMS3Bbin02]
MGDSEVILINNVERRRMDHHCCCRACECSGFDQVDLAATLFFCRCAENTNPDAELFDERGKCYSCSQGRGCDDVVATRMAYFGECVVLGADDHLGTRRPRYGVERCLQAPCRIVDFEAVVREEGCKAGRRVELLVGDLRVVIHPL